jgi:uncharacterized Rmd1/YagE family protein
MNKKSRNTKSNERLTFKDVLVLSVIVLLGITAMLVSVIVSMNQEDKTHIEVPKNLGAVYYTDYGVIVRFDLSDPRQSNLLQQLELLCKQNNIPNCMNAKDRLGIK